MNNKKATFSHLTSAAIMLCMLTMTAPEIAHGDTANLTLCNRVVSEWNVANNSANVSALSELYDNEVLFYGTPLKKKACLDNKRTFFNKNRSFTQSVQGIQAGEEVPGDIRCRFEKIVTLSGKTRNYPSYLVLRGDKIVTEGDEVTDSVLEKRKLKSTSHPKDAISADFNGDGTLDYAWLESPTINEDGMDCVGECICSIRFSDPRIPTIPVSHCISGTPDVLGDLNKNGTQEIGLSPGWFTSCWSAYYVWTLLNGKWVYAVQPITTHCNQFEDGIKPIEADARDGYVTVRSSEMIDTDIKVVTKTVPIAK